MKLLSRLPLRRDKGQKTLADYKREMMIRQGREQFKKLLDRGLGIPVAVV